MSRDKLVIFDLDGTLNRTDLYSVAAQQKALEEFGVTGIPEADLKGCLGGRPIDPTPNASCPILPMRIICATWSGSCIGKR